MLKILKILTLNVDDLKSFKFKRENLLKLINERIDCLDKLSVDMKIDPFSRIKIYEQIEVLKPFDECLQNIDVIKKKISQFDALLDELNSMSVEFMFQLRDKEEIIKTVVQEDILDSSLQEEADDNLSNDQFVQVLDNQVVSVKGISNDFNISIVSQKTGKVIKRVNEMVNYSKESTTRRRISDDVSPELVIVQSYVDDDDKKDKLDSFVDIVGELTEDFYDNIDSLDNVGEEVEEKEPVIDSNIDNVDELFENFSPKEEFLDNISDKIIDPVVVVNIDEQKNNNIGVLENEIVELENKEDFASSLDIVDELNVDFSPKEDIFIDDVNSETNIDKPTTVIEVENSIDSDIFTTVDPFVEASFFDDRIEEELFFTDDKEIKNDDDNEIVELKYNENDESDDAQRVEDLKDEMPEAFWVVEDDEKTVEDDSSIELSFDEQVDKLLADDKAKVKKLSA